MNKSTGHAIFVLCNVTLWHCTIHCVSLSAGLFESDKLLFSFAMTTKIQEVEGQLNHEELDFFIKVRTEHELWVHFVEVRGFIITHM